MLVGNSLILENPKVDENGAPTGVMQFKVDSTGAWLNNSTFVLQSDAGGKLMLHPDYGLVAGTSGLFETNGTQVLPSFIDEDGEITLDDDYFPKNANFYIDSRDGNAYFRGKVIATSGEFNGTVKAKDFLLNDGKGGLQSILKKVDGQDKIAAEWLDLYGINVKNQAGDTVLRIDEEGLRFAGSGNCQFSKNGSSNWHYPMESGDEYRRDFVRFGEQDAIVWGPAYRIVGRNGSNGSDANVTFANILSALQTAENTKTTFITADEVGAPTIYGAKIYGAEIYAGGVGEKGGQVIGLTDGGISIKDGNGMQVLDIYMNSSSKMGTLMSEQTMAFSAMNYYFSGGTLNLSKLYGINWGDHAPVARFG